ncbi:RHS repeat-associated core domain-containing protein [Fluviicola sp. SGL-29]|nr:RHS repeat-associated core domain-containing protein [Fluviicola sp. SGL-29]
MTACEGICWLFWLGGSKFTSGKPEKQQQKPSNYNPETDKAANKKVNGISDNATTIARYTYDDAEGVVNTCVHELSKLLTQTTYSYDERVRLDSIITKNLTVNPSSPELMKHLYHYDGSVPTYLGQYIPPSGFSYNGNINAVVSSYNFNGVYGSAPSEFNYAAIYGYKYDRLNRLVDADGFVGDFVVAAMGLGTNPTIAAVQIGDERYTYDKIGNIRALKRTIRHSDPLDNTVVSKNENWTYQYDGYNKLTQVTTGGSALLNRNYTYDKNGNLLTDSYREIAAMEYGRTAYPYYLEADNNEIYYLYSAEDQRMYKKVVTPTETTTEFYLQDATGKTVALRRKVGSAAATWEYYVNGSVREARIKNVTHNGIIAPQEIEFYLSDHLGNTRVVYEPTYAGGVLELAINYAADYFPYGKVLREYVNTSTGDPEKFLTTQHERDKETGLDYRGARYYDSDIARFLSLDPMQIARLTLTPYNYVSGNPIKRIDPDGKLDDEYDKNGKKISNLGGDKIDFHHQKDGSVEVQDKETGISNSMKAGEFMLGYMKRWSEISRENITDEFLKGYGPEKSLISSGSMIEEISISPAFRKCLYRIYVVRR